MKAKYLLFFLASLSFSCSSSDDNNDGGGNNVSTGDYMPLNQGNFWVYKVNMPEMQERDSLYVANDTVINNNSYKKFKTKDFAFGIFSGSLGGNGVRKSEDKILLSGTAGLNFSEDFPVNIGVSDFVIFKENWNQGQVLATTSGSFDQLYGDMNLTFTYALSSKGLERMDSFTTSSGETFNDVIAVSMVLNLKITSNYGGMPITIMTAQDVVTSSQYYAKNIGVVQVVTDINYNLQDFSAFNIELPIPQSGQQQIKEVLVNRNN